MKYVLLQAPAAADTDVFDLAEENSERIPEIRIFSEELPAYRRQISFLEKHGWKQVGALEADLTPRDLRKGLVTDTRVAGAALPDGAEKIGIRNPAMQLTTGGTADPERKLQEPPMNRKKVRERAGTYRKGKHWCAAVNWTRVESGKKLVAFPGQ